MTSNAEHWTPLLEFLTARYDEIEQAARAVDATRWTEATTDECGLNEFDPEELTHIVQHDPAHVLADIASKRAVAALAIGHESEVLRRLALPFADHPDYRQEWNPYTTT